MAERRMFTKKITESDAFLDMPMSSQCLYFHLNMSADDDGFVNNPRKIQRMIGANDDDFRILLMRNFILAFESGVIVIKHWKMHNYLRNDRYKPSDYVEEKSQLTVKENGSYTLTENVGIPNGYQMDTDGIPMVSTGKDRIEEDSIGNNKPKKTYVSLIAGFTENNALRNALNSYKEMRMKQKGFTLSAMELNLEKLKTMASSEEEMIDIVNQSVMNGWKSFYELKNKPKKKLPDYSDTELIDEDFGDLQGRLMKRG